MNNKIRSKIILEVKKHSLNHLESGEKEKEQDNLIEKECLKLGYTIQDFYNCDSKFLKKLL
jgi:hypothetical protein